MGPPLRWEQPWWREGEPPTADDTHTQQEEAPGPPRNLRVAD